MLIRQAHLQYQRVLWGLVPGLGLFVGPWVCWGTRHLQRNPETKPWQPFLRTTFRIALIITVAQWLGLLLIVLSFWTG